MRLTPLAALLIAAPLAAQPSTSANGPADGHFALVRPRFSGERALETVAFLDRYVRWPGNAGFDSSIAHIASRLAAAGFVEQSRARPADRLTYRIERYPMAQPAWEPLGARLSIAGADGETPVLAFATNRNMLGTNSFSTAGDGVRAALVRVELPSPPTPAALGALLDAANVRGRIVMADIPLGMLFAEAVQKRGAAGALSYSMPAYTLPEQNRHSIQFSRVPFDSVARSWGISLSYAAREQLLSALRAGPVALHVSTGARLTSPATEVTVVAEIRGSAKPDERFVWSAHVQEPGANDNASGVGALTEMARVAAELVRSGNEDPKRTLTFLWGLEIQSTRRFIQQDSVRAKGIRWGMSLDMVGEDTRKTGGTFLIEKMPDPSAVWTRGDDHHTEWGRPRPFPEDRLHAHYYNDYVLQRCLDQAAATGWVVRTNPFEGGSDHTSFLDARLPGVLFWHFTDHFYHTDGDRLDKVSVSELANSGIAALVSGLTLAAADGATARAIVGQTEQAALARLAAERALSADTLTRGGNLAYESHILATWGRWYRDALRSANDIEVGGSDAATRSAIEAAVQRVDAATASAVASLKAGPGAR